MAFPWLRVLDVVIGATDLARSRKIRTLADEQQQEQRQLAAGPGGSVGGIVEARLASVVVAALKEAGNTGVKFTELPGVGHNSWDAAYGNAEMAKWLFEQKRH